MTESGTKSAKPFSAVKPDKWFDLIYNEEDFARNIAIGAGAGAGLYFAWDQATAPFFAAAMAFSLAKLLASPWKRLRDNKRRKRQIRASLATLGHEEWAVVRAFVSHGGSVMTWGECNRHEQVSRAGIGSLIDRGLIQMSVTADAMTETFVLDSKLFDYAQEDLVDIAYSNRSLLGAGVTARRPGAHVFRRTSWRPRWSAGMYR